MMRKKLKHRILPNYTKGEDIMNMVTHIVGGALGICFLIICTLKAIHNQNPVDIIGSVIYGSTIIILFSLSSVYHGLRPGTGKKVLQILDHCSIYFLIAGTYTPIMLSAYVQVFPAIGWSILALEWGLGILAATLTAIDLEKYKFFSQFCYIFMGWCIILFIPQSQYVLGPSGFLFILWGGILYTIGAVLFAIGSKAHWFHSVFHIFVVLGCILHFVGIYFYVL